MKLNPNVEKVCNFLEKIPLIGSRIIEPFFNVCWKSIKKCHQYFFIRDREKKIDILNDMAMSAIDGLRENLKILQQESAEREMQYAADIGKLRDMLVEILKDREEIFSKIKKFENQLN